MIPENLRSTARQESLVHKALECHASACHRSTAIANRRFLSAQKSRSPISGRENNCLLEMASQPSKDDLRQHHSPKARPYLRRVVLPSFRKTRLSQDREPLSLGTLHLKIAKKLSPEWFRLSEYRVNRRHLANHERDPTDDYELAADNGGDPIAVW